MDGDSPVPLWAQLLQRLRERAAAGEFAAGFPLARDRFRLQSCRQRYAPSPGV